MPRVYLLNVGANTQHQQSARSPIFPNGSFVYVPFPTGKRNPPPGYSDEALRFTHDVDPLATHADPDWTNLTYGDYCHNARARALLSVERGDLLLFWGLLWDNDGTGWSGFNNQRGWYLLGALSIAEIVTDAMTLSDVPAIHRERAGANAHFEGRDRLETDHRVFVGKLGFSARFDRAVDLQVPHADGLIYRAIRSASGQSLILNGRPRWNSSLRSCRCVFDLSNVEDADRFEFVRSAVKDRAGIDLSAPL